MEEKKTYIRILMDSLNKKVSILDKIISINEEQQCLIKESKLDMDKFDDTLKRKEVLINELNIIDDGFNTLYERVREDLVNNRSQYLEEIRIMKSLISMITDKSVHIETDERRNKAGFESHLTSMKKEIGRSRKGLKTAVNYYKNASKLNVIESQFLDQKK